ncbi:MAG: hypothetical protein JNK82_13670, partial [Myxococcaceae bacterium]|nr:hypothetical protein [Myxococcaceae bacterium]
SGTAGGGTAGGSSLCDGVVCNMPPASFCNGSVLITFSGACNPQTGACTYTQMNTGCPQACVNGMCVGDPCAGVTCTTPPPPTCVGGSAVTFSLPGTCAGGSCSYPQMSTPCPGGCASGACVPVSATFTQVLPRVRHAITAIDQEPGSGGDDVIAVGPAGNASRWNGAQWAAMPQGPMAGNLQSVWFSGTNIGYVVADNGLYRFSNAGIVRVNLPMVTGAGRLVDVHGISDTNYAVVDEVGIIYRREADGGITVNAGNVGSRDKPPYRMRGVAMEAVAGSSYGSRLRYWGSCGTPSPAGCVVFQASTNGTYYDDRDSTVATVRSVGPSLDTNGDAWAGLETARVRRYTTNGDFDSVQVPPIDGGAVVAMTGAAPSATRATFVLTAPIMTSKLGNLYRITGMASAPQVDPLMNVFYGYQAMSKTESSGVIVVDMNTSTGASTITRRGAIANEVLDLGAEDWVAGAAFATGSVLMNGYGDVAIRNNASSTFVLRRFPFDLSATDIAAGSTFAVLTSKDGLAYRLPYNSSTFSALSFAVEPGALNAVCQASDFEWYLAGESGGLFRYDATTITPQVTMTSATFTDVDCPAAGSAVACGTGTVLRLAGGSWSALPNVPAGAITSCRLVGGAVYIAGPNLFARFANNTWSTLASRPVLNGLVVRSSNEAYAGSNNAVVRFDGTSWSVVPVAVPQALLAGFSMGPRVVLAGAGGVVMEGQ